MAGLQFTEVSLSANAQHSHSLVDPIDNFDAAEGGGVAVGDYNQDGHIDLYIVTGDDGDNVLLKNNGDGTFSNQTAGSGVALSGVWNSGPVFADINGDGWADLLVGSMQGEGFYVFLNDQDGTFTDFSASSNVIQQSSTQNDISAGLGDVDNDGDLDLFIGHHSFLVEPRRNHLWVNNGLGVFTAADASAGITNAFGTADYSFAATFADVNSDGWQDMLITADANQSRVFLNDGDGTFTDDNGPNFNDQFGMGSAVADFDNDGDLDWFVTSIHDHPMGAQLGRNGNRLYINDGSGEFTDDSADAGVRQGYWGWGACAADFDNDGWLDIFHVNGMYSLGGHVDFTADPSRLFLNDQDGTFTESSVATGLVDTGQGRTEVCFDYDEDGDIDIFVFNVGQSSLLYRNDLTDNPGYLQVDVLPASVGETTAGAIIEVITGSLTQTRHITVGSNFESQEPLRQHFGLGGASIVDQVRVTLPSGETIIRNNVAINQILPVAPEQPVFSDGFEL